MPAFCEIASGPDWHLRVSRSGRFNLRWSPREPSLDVHGEPITAWSQSSGKTVNEVFHGLFHVCADADLVVFRAALRAAGETHGAQARALQKEHSAKLRRAMVAAKAQRQGADLDAILLEIRGADQ